MDELRLEKAGQAIEEGLHEFMLHIQESCDAIYGQIYDMYLKAE